MKLTFKINLLFTVIVSGILLAVALLVYTVSKKNVNNDFLHRLNTRAARTAHLYHVFQSDTTNLLKKLDATTPPALVNKNIAIYDENRSLLYEYHDDSSYRIYPAAEQFEHTVEKGETYFRDGIKDVCMLYDTTGSPRFMVMVAADNIAGKQYINDLKRIFLLFYPGAVLVTLLAGYLFSRSIIRPVKATIHDVRLITSQNLSKRLNAGKRKDELAELNSTFNDLLDRLEEAFAIQRRFISNASHELSTPLTSVSSQIEVALMHDRSGEEYRAVLQSVQEDVKELNHLTRNLLEIAKAGTHGAISLENLRVDEILMKALGDVAKQDPAYRLIPDFDELPENEKECQVFGNAHLLYSAFRNILENGCKYAPDKTVQVQLHFNPETLQLHFINKSDLLPGEELNRLFEPFYRSSNANGLPGVGLGLTLTRRIIGLHKGTLGMKADPEQGIRLTIELPVLH